jgi:putative ABC transport system permease protein
VGLWRSVSRGLRVLTRRADADREIDEELAHFLEESAADLEARGMSRADARRAAAQTTGDTIRAREQVRDGGWEQSLATWLSDGRLAARMLRRTPVFSLVVIGVIALGTGAVTTVFSAMNAAVLRPIPGVAEPSRLVGVRPARADGSADEQVSYLLYQYVAEHTRTLSEVAVWGRIALTVSTGGPGVSIQGNMVSASYFSALGVAPAVGRLFAADEVRVPGTSPLLVVSDRFWREHLGGSVAAIGRPVIVNGVPFTVIGVAPPGFHGIYTGLMADAWVPITMQPQLRPRASLAGGSWTWMFGRLGPDVDQATSQAELSTLVAAHAGAIGRPATADVPRSARLDPLTGLPGGEGRGLLQFMSLLLGASGLVLLIAGVNVASMLSARYLARMREMAVRAALGAGRARLIRHLLTEVAVLFGLGALGGYAVACLTTSSLERLPLPAQVAVTLELSPDSRVFAFALAISLATGLIFGLGPSLAAARRDITTRLREQSAGAGTRRGAAARLLVAGQLACSLVLLVSAALFLRALDAGRQIDVGFDREHVMVAWLEPEAWGYDEPRARAFYAQLQDRVSALPGVQGVAAAGRVPLMMGTSVDRMTADTGVEFQGHYAAVGPAYFEVLALPLVAGRSFSSADSLTSARVAIVNEALASRIWPAADPVGRTLEYRGERRTVVGVARNAVYASFGEDLPPFAYFPVSQLWHPTQAMLARVAPGIDVTQSLQQAALAIDPRLPPPRVTTLARATDLALLPQRAAAVVTAVLGGVGLVLTLAGVYGVIAFSAGRRTREIGIRMALGASRSSVLSMIVREGLRLSAAGIVVGLGLAAAATRLLSPWLLEVNPMDTPTFAAVTAALLAAALAASYLPARRAASADPLESLRAE